MGSVQSVIEAQTVYGISSSYPSWLQETNERPSSQVSVDEQFRQALKKVDSKPHKNYSADSKHIEEGCLVRPDDGPVSKNDCEVLEHFAPLDTGITRRDVSRRGEMVMAIPSSSSLCIHSIRQTQLDGEALQKRYNAHVAVRRNFQKVLDSIKQLKPEQATNAGEEKEDVDDNMDEEEKQHIMEDIEGLRQYAHFHLHPEEHVVTTDVTACERNYFSRPSAPEQETREEAEEHYRILQDAAMIEENVQRQRYNRSLEHDYFHSKTEEMSASSPVCVKSVMKF